MRGRSPVLGTPGPAGSCWLRRAGPPPPPASRDLPGLRLPAWEALSSERLGACRTASPWTLSRGWTGRTAPHRKQPSRPEGRPAVLGGPPSSRHSHRPQLFPKDSGRLPYKNNEAEAWAPSRGPPDNSSRDGCKARWGGLRCPQATLPVRGHQARGLKWVLPCPVSEMCKTSLASTRFKNVRSSKMTPKYKRPLRAGLEAPTEWRPSGSSPP